MSIFQLQNIVASQILQTQDENLLQKILELLPKKMPKTKPKTKRKISINNPKHPFYDKLSPEEEKAVKESLAEHKAGKGVVLSTIEEMQNYFYNLS